MSPAGRSRGLGVLIAVLAVAAASVVARPGAGPAVADKPCATGDGGGGLVHCSDVGNDSLNGISIHILGH